MSLTVADAVVLGVVEGLTEFLPISSTGHLTIAEKILGLNIDDKSVTGFTAVIQVGAILAVLLYFRRDIWRFVTAGLAGLVQPRRRGEFDYRFAWMIVGGSIPIAVAGLVFKDFITGPLRSLWVVAAGLILWSGVMIYAERKGRHERGERSIAMRDALIVGTVQVVALVPGVSRSGATISAGLLRDFDRVAATRLSFFLSIPALVGAGLFELKDATTGDVSAAATAVGTVVSFVVAYFSIAWLLRFVAHHSIARFVPYRLALAAGVIIALITGALTAT